MAKKPNYFPSSEVQKRAWLVVFKENLPLAGQKLSLDPARIQTMTTKVEQMIFDIDKVSQKESELSISIEERNENRELSAPNMFDLVTEMKLNSNYLKSIGESLGVELNKPAKASRALPNIEKLEVFVKFKDKKVLLEFKKPKGVSVIIYCRRNGEDFIQLRQVAKNSYEDVRLNANNQGVEQRDYRFSMVKNDEETAASAIYSVAVIQ